MESAGEATSPHLLARSRVKTPEAVTLNSTVTVPAVRSSVAPVSVWLTVSPEGSATQMQKASPGAR